MSLSRPTRISARLLVPAVAAAALLLPQTSSPARADDPVAGAQTAGDPMFPNVGNGGYDVEHYDIDIAWTPTGNTVATPAPGSITALEGAIDATALIRATTTGAPLSSYSLDFEGPGLSVRSVTVDGELATITRDEQPGIIRHKLVVTPATPVSGAFTTVVEYDGIPSRHIDLDGSFEGWNVTADGATALNQPIGAMTVYPNNNTPDDKATYTIDVDIPDTITNSVGSGASAAASNGELVDKVVSAPGRTTWRWVQTRQMASELFMVSIGKYDVLESDVTLSDGSTIHEWTFVDSATSAANKLLINNRRPFIGTITRGLETVFGPYPGGSTGAVIDAVPSGISYALETQDRSFFPTTGSFTGNTLTHELAHQWYGNTVSPVRWTDIWINEGMGTWGPTHYNNVIAATSLTSTHAQYHGTWNSTSSTSNSWRTPPGAQTDSGNLYGYQTYTRGAQLYEALKLSIGDEAFFRFLEEWPVRFNGQSRGIADFRALAEEISGKDLEAFFQDWVLDPDKPAWPQRYDLGLTAEPTTGPLAPGDTVTYTLSAANMGRVQLSPAGGIASVAEVDLADVLDDATIDAATLPAGLVVDGTTLTWTVPTTAAAVFVPTGAATPTTSPISTVSFPVVVKPSASLDTLAATASSVTLGGFCGPVGCATSADVPIQPVPSAPPVVTGTPRVDVPLTASTAGWAAGTTFTYQWAVAGTPVEGATASTFTPRPDDVGKTVTVTVTGTHPDHTPVTRTSEPSAPIALGVFTRTSAPYVVGRPQVGSPLTAQTGTWDEGTTFAHQWRVDGVAVEGATGPTFTPRPADLGKVVTVAVTGSKPGYADVTRVSGDTAPVVAGTQAAPTPTVAGTARVGETLTATPGAWDPATTLTYQWSVDGRPVNGATSATFVPRPADVGRTVTVAVTGTRDGFATVTRTSEPTAPVAPGDLVAGTPSITGTPQVGVQLTGAPGEWPAGTTLTYQWLVGDEPVAGATGTTFTPRPGDVGETVRLDVTGTEPGYAATTASAETDGPVLAGELDATPVPTVTGPGRVGTTLGATAGAWDDGVTLTYLWVRNGFGIPGADGPSYRLTAPDLGKVVRVVVTGSRPGYTSVTRVSAKPGPVTAGRLTRRPTPTVAGRPVVGGTLRARPGAHDAGVSLAFRWYVAGVAVAGPRGAGQTYTPRAADRGRKVKVRVVATKPGYASYTRKSEATTRVR